MRKIKPIVLFLFLAAVVSFTSCSKVEELPKQITSDVLASDLVFENAIKSTLEFVAVSQANNWEANGEEIYRLMNLADNGDATANASLTELLGMERTAYVSFIEEFAVNVNNLNEKYPSLLDMNSAEKNALYAAAITSNENIQSFVFELQETYRACLAQDICNGVVNLAALIGGPVLCDVIANAIPVVGSLVCNLVLDLSLIHI